MPQDRSLEGKLAIITGASRGIGSAVATNLASKGCNVVLNYTSESSAQKAEALAADLASKYAVKTTVVRASVGAEGSGQQIVDAATKAFPNHTIDIIINNAGVADLSFVQDVKREDFWRLYEINVLGPILLVQAAFPHLPKDRSGRIVNVSSISSAYGVPGQSVYGGTKAALEAMTRSWARELNGRATVNSINPGPVGTEGYDVVPREARAGFKPYLQLAPLMQSEGRNHTEEEKAQIEEEGGIPAEPREIAGIVGMLCSAESAWCTGSVVNANGGAIMTR